MIRRYVVTSRHPGQHTTTIASRHFTHRAAHRRATWLRALTAYAGADVRARHLNDQEH